MLLTYTGSRNLFGNLTNNSTAVNLTLGDTFINLATRDVINGRNWEFLEKTKTDSTVASQQAYILPHDYGKMISVTIDIGTFRYQPKECPSAIMWNNINRATSFTSTYAQWYFIQAGQIKFYPTPSTSTAGNIIYTYSRNFKDMAIADYTTGTIVSLANGASAIVGNGTTWTAAMVGRYITIPVSQGGDGLWYEISAFTDATHLTIIKKYGGTSIAAASATYTIGETSPLLEEQHISIYKACELYFTTIQPDVNRAALFKRLSDEGLKGMINSNSNKTFNPVIEEQGSIDQNPNLFLVQ